MLGQGAGHGKGKTTSRDLGGHLNECDTVPLPACSLPAAEATSEEDRVQLGSAP